MSEKNATFDYMIVGQGIAGSVLAETLIGRGKKVLVIDDPGLSATSRIAAGLYNPVVFKRLVKSWLADELIACMDSFYPAAEKKFNGKFYFKNRIIKLFTDENEKTLWLKRQSEDVGKYLSPQIQPQFLPELLMSILGASEVINAGHLDTSSFLDHCRKQLKNSGALLEEKFDFSQLAVSENEVKYKTASAAKIIFCEGHKCLSNPYFSDLPFKLTKGEILTVKIPALGDLEEVINKGVFILPLGNHKYKVGATYEWSDLSEQTTGKGRLELEEKLRKVIRVPFEVIDHSAGVRPTVSDRRPLIGLHPAHSSVGIFNGLGTKGVMLAPFFAAQFAAYLEGKGTLHPEVNIARFQKG